MVYKIFDENNIDIFSSLNKIYTIYTKTREIKIIQTNGIDAIRLSEDNNNNSVSIIKQLNIDYLIMK